ncbi:hypothetical protein IKQ74_01485 [Candidatus Saccharibacteria bacterium]|nr:hypothetical protein [Candidatus Saccharibacteria bacterium]
MDLDNQNSATANTNTDSAASDFGAPVSFADQSADMNAINEAIAATNDGGASSASAFDINDISLDDVPSSQDELDRRLEQNPGMNLAGGPAADSAAAANPMPGTPAAADAATMNNDPAAEKPAAPSASFVSGDIVDETEASDSQPAEVHREYDNINTDPLANFETAPVSQAAPQVGPTNPSAAPTEAPAAAAPAAEQPAPAPAAADAITVPGRKSKTPIIIAAGLVVVAIIVGVVIFFVTKK